MRQRQAHISTIESQDQLRVQIGVKPPYSSSDIKQLKYEYANSDKHLSTKNLFITLHFKKRNINEQSS